MNRRKFIELSAAAASVSSAMGSEPAKGEAPVLSFGLITDVQYADAEPQGERHFRESPGKLKTAVAWLSKRNLPFTLHLGDFIDREYTAFATVLPLLDDLGHPVHHLLGNHDYDVTDAEKDQIVTTLGMPHDYYSFRSSGVRIVMLDTNDVSVYKHAQGSEADLKSEAVLKELEKQGHPNAKPWNGGLSETQLAWLDKELTVAGAAGERVILCGHHPLLPAEGHTAWNHDEALAIIDRQPCVIAYLNGHNHAGAEIVRNGVPYITFKSILHEPGINAWSAIHLHKDRLEIEGNGREVSRTFPVRPV